MAYHGRRGPNVSEYIANLNAIPSASDLSSSNAVDPFLEDDLAMFTNTQFFDFDLGQESDLQPTSGFTGADEEEMKDMALPIQGDFTFPDFSTFSHSHPAFEPPAPIDTSLPYAPSLPDTATTPTPTTAASTKRKSDSISGSAASPPATIEDASRLAAEEDKRRRNTAASARFRVKKKQREQALEKSAKEMSDKVSSLEQRIGMLETENKWLKNLIVEKNRSSGAEGDVEDLWRKFRDSNEGKKGVGTPSSETESKRVKA